MGIQDGIVKEHSWKTQIHVKLDAFLVSQIYINRDVFILSIYFLLNVGLLFGEKGIHRTQI